MRYIEVPAEFQPGFTGNPYPQHQKSHLIEKRCADYFCSPETEIESDITRNGNALDTQVVSVETDEGSLFPVGGIRMTIRCMYQYQSGTP